MDISPFFYQNEAANDETTQFLSNIFVKSMGLTVPEPDNYYCPGIVLTISPVELLEFSVVGASVEDNNWEDLFKAMAEQGDDQLLDGDALIPTAWDEEEWEW